MGISIKLFQDTTIAGLETQVNNYIASLTNESVSEAKFSSDGTNVYVMLILSS